MRIALLSQPNDPIASGTRLGSVAIVLVALATRLARRHTVTVLAPRAPGAAAQERTSAGFTLLRPDLPAARLHRLHEALLGFVPGALPAFARERYHAAYRRRVARLAAGLRPDIVHVMTLGQWLPALARALPSAKLVLHLHDELHLRLDPDLARRRLQAAAAIVTVSDWLARRLAERFPDLAARIHSIGNGVDLERFTPSVGQGAARGRSDRILFVGRISPEKGVHVLLEAFARLAPRRPGLVLELVGEPGFFPRAYLALLDRTPALRAALGFYGHGLLGGRRGYLEAMIRRLPVELRPRVVISRAVPHDALVDHVRSADLLVAPSVCNEPFCLPVAEAMASGLPCIVSRAGAPPELIGAAGDGLGEAGIAVPPGDPAALAAAIERLLDDPDRRRVMGRAARGRAERFLGWDAAAVRLEAVYRSLAEAARA